MKVNARRITRVTHLTDHFARLDLTVIAGDGLQVSVDDLDVTALDDNVISPSRALVCGLVIRLLNVMNGSVCCGNYVKAL
jgi:hypothetical protein